MHDKIKKVARISGWIAIVALIVAWAAEIFGGAHAAFWHIIPQGYVETFSLLCSRYSGCAGPIYVKPWVRVLNITAGCTLFLATCVWLAAGIAIKRREALRSGETFDSQTQEN